MIQKIDEHKLNILRDTARNHESPDDLFRYYASAHGLFQCDVHERYGSASFQFAGILDPRNYNAGSRRFHNYPVQGQEMAVKISI